MDDQAVDRHAGLRRHILDGQRRFELCLDEDEQVVDAPGQGGGFGAPGHMIERPRKDRDQRTRRRRSEEHTSELQSLMRISYAVFCLKKKKKDNINKQHTLTTQNKKIKNAMKKIRR